MVENELFPRVPNKNPVGSFGAFFPPRKDNSMIYYFKKADFLHGRCR